MLKKVMKIIKKQHIYLPLIAFLSAVLSYALESTGWRARLGIGDLGFSYIAFISLSLLFFIIISSFADGVGAHEFNPCSRRHMLLFGLTALFCFTICLSAINNTGDSIVYPMTSTRLEGSNPYVQQFDALSKGQVSLDLPVSDELAAMENPYDKKQREEDGVRYFWDRAFYNGKYFSYFGLAPIFCVYYPYYALTGNLPSSAAVCLILALFTVTTLSLALFEFIIFVRAKPKLWLTLLALLSLAFGSGLYAAISYGDVYYIPVLSAMCFNFSTYFFVFRAVRTKGIKTASVLFALASLSFVLAVMSRPTASLMCVAAAPAVIDRIFIKTHGAAKKTALLAPAATVAFLGAAVVMTFNYLRFGSPIDFGANYQLTVCDISKNTLTFALLPEAFTHYVLQVPEFIPSFPFVIPSYLKLEYGRYMYLDYNTGMLFFPATLGLFAGPFFARFKRAEWVIYLTFITGVVLIAFVIFVDFCKAGVNMRYLYDFLTFAVTLGTVLFLRASSAPKRGWLRVLLTSLAALAFAATVLMSFGVISANEADRLFALTKSLPPI